MRCDERLILFVRHFPYIQVVLPVQWAVGESIKSFTDTTANVEEEKKVDINNKCHMIWMNFHSYLLGDAASFIPDKPE